MIRLAIIPGVIILAILLIYFANLSCAWMKPSEYNAAITFKDFLTLYKISTERWRLGDCCVIYKDKDGYNKDVCFVTFKEFYKYYKWYKKYSKEKAIEATLNNTQELRKEWDELLRQEKKNLYQHDYDYYERVLNELKDKYNINF